MEWDLLNYKSGDIVEDFFEDGIRVLIKKGIDAWCAYLGVPENHPLAGFNHSDLPIDVHCGFSLSKYGNDDNGWPAGYYWFGWAYDHHEDCQESALIGNDCSERERFSTCKKWTIPEVKMEARSATINFKELTILAEKMFFKGAKIIPTMKELNNVKKD